MAKTKPHINVVFVGHVDHGKSTTVGRLLFDAGVVSEQDMKKLQDKAKELGKVGFEFAYVMDNLKEEQERGVTIDLSHKKFSTPKFDYTIIDAPGHKDFVKNMITGASQADAAVLVCGANEIKGTESITELPPQTIEHARLTKILGVGQLICVVNKMDMQGYAQERFEGVKKAVSQLLQTSGWKLDKVKFIPIASLKGDNVAKKSTNMSWYTGPTLLEALDQLDEPQKPTQLPLRLPLQDVYKIAGIGTVPVGKVETGVMKLNDKVVIVPGREGKGISGEVKTIEMHHEMLQEAEPGDNVGFVVRGVEKKDVARGDVLGHVTHPPTVATEFTAQIVVLNHPSVITVGYTPVFHIHTAQIACQVMEIVKKLDPATGATVAEHPDFIKNGDAAIVKLKPMQPLCIETNKDIPQMARFAIRDSGVTVAAGICIDLVKKTL
ncbi:MAG TPA: translation elongation factor EF-1 subunit alpha [Candidatus Nanoarchaeia archaeon]|nr:translation elongation factor EF-1 subunit alpha [Candidatus Nanoarchaeia archaeon]